MRFDQNIEPVVERLERSLMPHFAEFATAIMRSDNNVLAETSSNRHLPFAHVFGVSCRPVGTSILDPTTVALVVNINAVKRLNFNACIVWQVPMRLFATRVGIEARTASFHKFTERTAIKFEGAVLNLLPALANAMRRGSPALRERLEYAARTNA